jgi:GNAT superfamily N-acetyltransferase
MFLEDTVRMQIDYLADHPEFLPTLAQWHHQEWGYMRPGDSAEARAARTQRLLGHDEIPTVFVAFSGSVLFGSAMLIAHDMETRKDLTPWLAGVYVAPEHRRKGIGSALVGRVVECAERLGAARLYLYTPSAERMYSRLGWTPMERVEYRGSDVLIMQRSL